MIELLEGVPGSGKSYYAVSERFLTWLRSHRKIYIYVDGIFLDKLAAFEGRSVEDLQHQLVLWQTADEVRSGLLQVDPGAAVLIDEAQTIFRAKDKVDPELLRWLETHRHRGNDVVLMVQQYGQLTLGVTRLVEVTTKFRRLDRFGLRNRYQAQVRGNPEETEVIRMFSGTYSPAVYQYYASYSQAAITESKRGATIMRSPTIIVALLGLGVAVYWFSSGQWITPPERVTSPQPVAPAPVSRGGDGVGVTPVEPKESALPLVHPIHIQGGIGAERNGQPFWLWLAADGRFLTEDEIAAESGGTVISSTVRGVRRLSGSGVIYDLGNNDGLMAAGSSGLVDHPLTATPQTVVDEITSVEVPSVPDPFATPPAVR